MQHGSAPTSLIARAAEQLETKVPMRVARVTVDLLRPVPLSELEIDAQVVREGRKIQVCSVRLLSEGVEVVRASVLKIRTADLGLPADIPHQALDLPLPEEGRAPERLSGPAESFGRSLDIRVVKGSFGQSGPGAAWFRLTRPMVAGEDINPLIRAAAVADFCNGISAAVDRDRWTFINGDLSFNLFRYPVGEWILLDAETWVGPDGLATAFGRMADRTGYFGRSIQSILIQPVG